MPTAVWTVPSGAYLAYKNDDQALREKTASEWKTMHGYDGSPDLVNCTGCKGDGVVFSNCQVCPIRKCASEKGVEPAAETRQGRGSPPVHCGVCPEFDTCNTINDFIAAVPFVKDNLVQK